MTAWLRTLGPLGLLLAVTAAVLLLAALMAAVGVIAWVLSGEGGTDDGERERHDGDEPDPPEGELVPFARRPSSDPPPSDPRRAA